MATPTVPLTSVTFCITEPNTNSKAQEHKLASSLSIQNQHH